MPYSQNLSRLVSRLVRPVGALSAALCCAAAVAAVLVVAAGPARTTERPAVTVERPAALLSVTGDLGYYRHDVATVIRIPDTDPASPSYTPPVCLRRQILLDTGSYIYGTSFGWQGDAYDNDNLFLHGGIYTWSDCLFASGSGGYLQLSRLNLGGTPDDGLHDAAVITHPREVPDWRDADDAGRFAWGSFLTRTD